MDMTKCILFGILSLGLLLFQSTDGSVAMDYSCVPRNCSQPPLKAGLPSFPCYIGHRKECDAAESWFYNRSTSVGYHSFAYLTNIGTYMYMDRTNTKQLPNPSLNFTITTPYGGVESVTTRAVKVRFDSPAGYGEDSFYNKNPRCRLFDFRNATRNSFDISHPRELNYACLVGLSIRNEVTYQYRLKLTSLPSFAAIEYFLVVHSEPRKMHKYKIVLATAVIPLHQSLHVVWEQPPLDFNIVSYNVTLTSTTQGQLSTKTIKFGAQDFEFKNLKPDVYVARVEPKTKNGSTPCSFTESKPIRLVYTLEDNGPEFSMLNTALAVVGGTVLGAILLIFLIICWKKQYPRIPRQHQRILIGADTDGDLTQKVATVFRRNMNVNVTVANNTPNIPFENLIKGNVQNTIILIVCSKNAAEHLSKRHLPNYSNDYFCRAMTYLQNHDLQCKVYIACAHVESNCPHIHLNLDRHLRQPFWKPSSLLRKRKEEKVYNLLDDFGALGKKFGKGFVNKHYDKSNEWIALKQTIEGSSGPSCQGRTDSSTNLPSGWSSEDSCNSMFDHMLIKRTLSTPHGSESGINASMEDCIAMPHDTQRDIEDIEEESNFRVDQQQLRDIHKFASCHTLQSKDIELPRQRAQETPYLRSPSNPQSRPPLMTQEAHQPIFHPRNQDAHCSIPFSSIRDDQQPVHDHTSSEVPGHDQFDTGCYSRTGPESDIDHVPGALSFQRNVLQEHPDTHFCQIHNKCEIPHQFHHHGQKDLCQHERYGDQPYHPSLQHSETPHMPSSNSGHLHNGYSSGNMSLHYRPEDENCRSRCKTCHRQNSNVSRHDSDYSSYSRQDSINSRHDSSHSSTFSQSPPVYNMRGKDPLFSNDPSFNNSNYQRCLEEKTSSRYPPHLFKSSPHQMNPHLTDSNDYDPSTTLHRRGPCQSSQQEMNYYVPDSNDVVPSGYPHLQMKDACQSSPDYKAQYLQDSRNCLSPAGSIFLPPESPDNMSLSGEFFIDADESGEAHIASKSFQYDPLPVAVEEDEEVEDQTFERTNSDPETCSKMSTEVGKRETDSGCFQSNNEHLGQIPDNCTEQCDADLVEPLLKMHSVEGKDSGMFSMK